MKLLIILFMIPCFLQAQNGTIGMYIVPTTSMRDVIVSRYESITTYDTTIIYKGIDSAHTHEFVMEFERIADQKTTEWVCIICLWDYKVRESTKLIDRFEQAKEKIDKMIKAEGIKL